MITFDLEVMFKCKNVLASYPQVRPEIKHVFRSPDQRPSSVVSSTFTVLCVLPLLLLLIMVNTFYLVLLFSSVSFEFVKVFIMLEY